MTGSLQTYRSCALVGAFALCVGGMGGFVQGVLAADDLVVKYDQSQLVKLPVPVTEIIIGNPTIVEVTAHSRSMLIVTGKTFGITNVIALDAEKNTIYESRVMVVRDEGKVVNLQKGGKRESYNCTPQCNPSIVIGDDPAYFNSIKSLSESKMKYSEPAAE